MRIFIYEHITAGAPQFAASKSRASVISHPSSLSSLLAEGAAMLEALAADFLSIGSEVDVLRDARLQNWQPLATRVHDVQTADQAAALFDRLAAVADWTVIIAPECDGILLELAERAAHVGARLLCPASELVTLAADKHATCEHLQAAGIPLPPGLCLEAGEAWPSDFGVPAVSKPRYGAGSQHVRVWYKWPPEEKITEATRLERYQPGMAASIALLGGPRGQVVLPACRQRLSDDGTFAYLGGSCPLPKALDQRAAALAQRVAATLPPWNGYLGIDLVLGDADDGRGDMVIEVNPRLTTSYVGLRELVDENLAAAMLRVAGGDTRPLCRKSMQVEFDARGELRISDCGLRIT